MEAGAGAIPKFGWRIEGNADIINHNRRWLSLDFKISPGSMQECKTSAAVILFFFTRLITSQGKWDVYNHNHENKPVPYFIEFTEVFWTFSIVLYLKKHDISETGSVSVLRWRWGRRHLLSWAPRVFWNTGRWKKSRKIMWILYNIHHRQNPFKSISSLLYLL
jgi:hypothetical protein